MHQGSPAEIVGSDIEPLDTGLFDTARRVALRQQWELVLELLEGLAHDRRAVFVLHELEERTMEEIAAELEISRSTVQSRLRAARAQFDEALRRRRAIERRVPWSIALRLECS
jgi:RNA polymerase sigma factor (sigma-70 family)